MDNLLCCPQEHMDSSLAVRDVGGTPILLQNRNGPCFLIALVNAIVWDSHLNSSPDNTNTLQLSLRDLLLNPSVPPTTSATPATPASASSVVTLDTLYAYIVNTFINNNNDSPVADNTLPNPETAISDDISECNNANICTQIMDVLPVLNSGLLVNPSFDNIRVTDFNQYSEIILSILSKFDLNLYHGFIMDDVLLHRLDTHGILPTFDKCQDYLISQIDDNTHTGAIKDFELIAQLQDFINNHKTELSEMGISKLQNNLKENQIFIFFRNDHFNTCINHNNQIYLLVTDLGYINQPDIIWMPLLINDSGDFLNSNFEPSQINTGESEHSETPQNIEDPDTLLAKQLQLQEDEKLSKSLQSQYNRQQQKPSQLRNRQGNTKIIKKSPSKHKKQSNKSECILM